METVQSTGPKKGSLILTGDAIYGTFLEKFIELIGGPEAPVVLIPTALAPEDLTPEAMQRLGQYYIDAGLSELTLLHTSDPEQANTNDFVEPIKNAAGLIFGGGRQWRLSDAYLGTKAHDEFLQLLNRGGVIAGGSAGATIQGSYLARGDSRSNKIMMGDHETGLGFISNVAIDQHLLKRNRQFDMFEILDQHPGLLGIGLDEGAGIVVQQDRFEVIGESYVAIYDGTIWSKDEGKIRSNERGSRAFYLLQSGDQYDLKRRCVII